MGQSSHYIAVILAESTSTAEDHDPLLEESFVLLEAVSPKEARDKALERTSREQGQYRSVSGDTVTWSSRLVELKVCVSDEFKDGSEIHARFLRNKSAYEELGFETFARDET